MPAKKKSVAKKTPRKASAKRSTTRSTKAATKKKVARKAVSKKVTKKTAKKTAAKKVTKKAAKKVTKKAAKKPPAKKVAKKAAKKTPAKKVAKKAAKKTAAKKTAAKKKVTRKTAPKKRPGASRAKSPSNAAAGLIHGIEPYQPRRGEEYMSEAQLDHFREVLLAWRRELMEEVDRTVHHMQDEASNFPDPNDRATQESEFGLELRTRDRERKLLRKIGQALERIDDGSYGFCEETGEEIGLQRLEARPVATLCVEAQERREVAERQYRDREDRYR